MQSWKYGETWLPFSLSAMCLKCNCFKTIIMQISVIGAVITALMHKLCFGVIIT